MKTPKHFCILLIPLLAAIMPNALSAQDFDAIYATEVGPGTGELIILTRASHPASVHYLDSDGNLASLETTPAPGIPGWREALLAQPSHAYAGFSVSGQDTLAVPVFFPDAQGIPTQNRCLPVESDPQGDHQFNLDNLDILSTRIAFSESRIHYYIKCNTTSYPVSNGLTFYSYMGIFTQPNADPDSNPIVFGLMNTVEAPGIISPGLYKIVGTGMSDLINIGDIGVEVDSEAGALILSCEISDLLADQDFAQWYNPGYPLLATVAMTSRITLSGGNQQADATTGSDVLLLPQPLNFANNHAPQVNDPVFTWQDGALAVSAMYSDADQNPAWALRVSIDGGGFAPLYPLDFEGYGEPVAFAADGILCPQNWENATFTVINGGVSYSFEFPNPNVSADDELASAPRLEIYPNPVGDLLSIKAEERVKLFLYNIRGQLIRELDWTEKSIDLSGLAPGVYVLRQGSEYRRFLKL